MKIQQTDIDQIKTAFEKMQSREDLLHLLNVAKPLVYGEKAVPFVLKQLTWYSNPKLAVNRYTEFKIKKKSGDDRIINAPVEGLKAIQKTLSFVLQCVFEPHKAAMGFVRDKSIVDNARLHAGSRYVYNIDLKDFFPSIDQARVWKCLQLKPFNLVDINKKIDSQIIEYAIFKILTFKSNDDSHIALNNKILKYTYDGCNFPAGFWNGKLKNGGNLFYQIEKNTKKDNAGTITLFKNKSKFEGIREIANNSALEKNVDSELELKTILLQLITTHQRKIKERNTRMRLANIIAALCCTEMEVERKSDSGEWEKVKRNVLPQGAPTSPIITNVICHRLDYLLTAVAKRFGLKYSRYADDMTFSSMHNVFQKDSEFLKELHRIIFEQGFNIKESKTRLQKEGFRQEVTGLLVNEKVNVQKRYIKQLREWLYKWETYGYNKANSFFIQNYLKEKGNVKKGIPNMTMVLDGKLQYLKMVKGDKDGTYLKLKERFVALYGKISPINSILDIWENEGIDKAIEVFYLQNPNKSAGEVASNEQLDNVFNYQFIL
jgi:hypothetical protein